jgi:quinol monooxygenase YgiN
MVARPAFIAYGLVMDTHTTIKESDMKATYGFRATIPARKGKGDELVALLLTAQTSEHCVLYLVGRSASDPDIVYVTEGWTSKEAHAANFASDRAKAFVASLAPLVRDGSRYEDEVPVGGTLRGGAL